MKKFLLFITLLSINISAFAQANPFTPASGALPNYTVGSAYSTNIVMSAIPSSVTVNTAELAASVPALQQFIAFLPATLDITVTSVTYNVTGLLSGLSATCNPSGCTYNAGVSGSIDISGTTTDAVGTDTLRIKSLTTGSTILATPLGDIPVSFPGTVQGQTVPELPTLFDGGPYTLHTTNAVEQLEATSFDVIQNIPNPFTGNTTIKFSTPTAGNVDFTVFDMIGKRVYSEKIQAQAKTNSIVFSSEKLNAGTYFYSLSNGTKTITKKMIVAGK